MPTITQRLDELGRSLGSFAGIARAIIVLCVLATLTAVLVNFLLAKKRGEVTAESRSKVATASMLGFFAGYYCLIRFQIGVIPLPARSVTLSLACVGLALVVVGTGVNILGRCALGGNWGDQIRIYRDHQLVTGGVYRYVRHPLYASLIWMFFGAALFFQNWLALAADLGIFLPAMCYRGRQEEVALRSLFPLYAEYARKTGMFFPLPWTPK
jgi:protein-S-isoprenylcysteine O-methyltransferase Ste14